MGQYHYVVNLDKKQMLDPHEFGEGLKLLEFTPGGFTMQALGMLLATSDGRGGGDYTRRHELTGSWAGDRIVIIGDYAEKTDQGVEDWMFRQHDKSEYGDTTCLEEVCEDISSAVFQAMADSCDWVRSKIRESSGYLMDRAKQKLTLS